MYESDDVLIYGITTYTSAPSTRFMAVAHLERYLTAAEPQWQWEENWIGLKDVTHWCPLPIPPGL